jgi:hypothetical protein
MNDVSALEKSLEADLLKLHGPIMTGAHLLKALGYVSQEALRQSMVRDTVPVPIFKMEKRRGYFVLVKDVASYLANRRHLTAIGGSNID